MLVLLVLLLTGVGGLAPVLLGSAWWGVMAMMMVLTLAALAALRRIGVPRVLVPLAGLGVIMMLLTFLFGEGTGLLWLIPTSGTVAVLSALSEQGVDSINEQTTPAVLTAGITFLLAAGACLLAWLVHLTAVTLRVPAIAGLAVLPVVLIPGLALSEGVSTVSLLLVAAAYLWLLRVDVKLQRRPDRPWGGPGSGGVSVVLGGVTLVAALTVSLVVSPVASSVGGSASGALFGAGVSPLVDLGQDLRRPRPGPALNYVTTAENAPYLTLLTLDRFVGTTWTAGEDTVDESNTVDVIDRPAGLDDDVATADFTSSIVIDGVRSPLLPLPMPATRVEGLTGDWFWNGDTLTVKGRNVTTQGQTYTVSGFEVEPTALQLRAASRDYPADAAANLELPGDRPGIIDETALSVTKDSASAYDSAVALQDYLNDTDFRYDTEAPVDEGYDGGGLGVVGTFLEVKSGYCVHFSSAMAVMARALGIPARISIGYLPGTGTVDQGIETFEVDSHDLHAWPELYFVGVGWVPFEPTPGRGSVPDYAQASANPAPSSAPGRADAPEAPLPQEESAAESGPVPGQTETGDPVLRAIGFWPGTVLLLVLLVGLIPGLLRGWRRSARLRRIRTGASGSAGAAIAWQEVTDTALDLGAPVRPADTPRETAGRLADRIGASAPSEPAREALGRLLDRLERLRFARPGVAPLEVEAGAGGALVDDVQRVLRGLVAASPRRVRVRAALMPASLTGLAFRRGVSGARGRVPTDA